MIRKPPQPALERLATYFTVLSELNAKETDIVSSPQMEELTGIDAAQFRKDLSYFGEFGRPGIGYSVSGLYQKIASILKIEKEQPVLLVGAGNLGSAIVGYPGLGASNFKIVAVFDNNPKKIGRRLWNIEIQDVNELIKTNARLKASLAILAVPASAAQEVAELLVKANVRCILNFAPVTLRLPKEVTVRNADFVQGLTVLSYYQVDDQKKETSIE